MFRGLPQSPSVPAFGPGRKHSLLPALAKNMPPAYFLNASRPPGGSLFRTAEDVCPYKMPASNGQKQSNRPALCEQFKREAQLLRALPAPEGAYKRQGLVSRLALYKGLRCEAQRLSGLPDPAPEGTYKRQGLVNCPALSEWFKREAQCLSGLPDPAAPSGLKAELLYWSDTEYPACRSSF